MGNTLSEDALNELIRPIPSPRYSVDVGFGFIERQLDVYDKDYGGLNLAPDFQRGHVWTDAQRTAYIEGICRGTVRDHLRVIQFNIPQWDRPDSDRDLPDEVQIIDGLQRLTTVRKFLAGEVRAFGMTVDEFDDTPYSFRRIGHRMVFAVHSFQYKRNLLQYYLDINAGGTPHSDNELQRIKKMLEESTRAEGVAR